MRPALPEWMRSRDGGGPLLVVAPHGGVSDRDLLEPPSQGTARSNDLYTADLAEALATRLDASLLANVSRDRNALDLNRISEVVERAPWFADAVAAHLERILARHPLAEVVFVHGWHVVQAKCDVGVGAALASPADAALRSAALTVSREYLATRVEALRTGCAAAGIASAYGERWPAAHVNNVMQLFRRVSSRRFGGAAARIAASARAGRVAAIQLELGASVRWPGPVREAFLDAAVGVWSPPAPGARRAGPTPVEPTAEPRAAAARRERRAEPRAGREPEGAAPGSPGGAVGTCTLQAHDPRAGTAGLGIAAAMGRMPGGRLGGRLLLFPGGDRLVLFTGEERDLEGRCVGGLAMEATPAGVVLRFRGPALLAPDAAAHFRSERQQARATVALVRADLELRRIAGGEFGEVAGWVEIDGCRFAVATHGFSTPPLSRGAPARGAAWTRLAASFGPDLGLALTLGSPSGEIEGERFAVAGRERLWQPRSELRPRRFSPPSPFEVAIADDRLACRPRTHLSWLRPAPDGGFARVTLGVAEFALGGGSGSGFYEHVEPAPEPPPADVAHERRSGAA